MVAAVRPGDQINIRDWAAWDPYTPTLSSSGPSPSLGTGGSIKGWSRRRGSSGALRIVCTFGTSGGGGTGTWQVSLPSGWVAFTQANGYQTGRAMLNDTGTAVYKGMAYVASAGTQAILQCFNAAGTYLAWAGVASTVPFTWTNTDFFVVEFDDLHLGTAS